MKEINECQNVQLRRIRLGSFNEFDGEYVADQLSEHRDLWDSFVFGRFKYGDLIELRDLPSNCLNADTIMLLTTLDRWQKLEPHVLKNWAVDEVGWTDSEGNPHENAPFLDEKELFQAFGGGLEDDQIIVRLWWD